MRDVLGRLLDEHAEMVPPELMAAFAIVMRSSLGTWTQAPDAPVATSQKRQPPHASQEVRKDLAVTLASLFPSDSSLRQFLRRGLDRSSDSIALGQGDPQSAWRSVVTAADTQGWLDTLIAKAREACPTSVPLARAAEKLGLSGLASSDPGFMEDMAIMRSAPGADDWGERLAAIERQVCRVESNGGLLGTAFLIGADLVLTADHVLGGRRPGSVSSAEVTLRFDLTTGHRNRIVTEGTRFRPGEVVWRNAELDYVLLRVHGSPGVQPIGGGTGPGGTLRRWIDVSEPASIRPGSELVMVGYARERPPALTFDRGAVITLRDDRVVYTIESEPGASGAPCFTPGLELVALLTHQNNDPDAPRTASVGVLLSAVLRDLRDHGFGHLVGAAFA